MADPGEGPGGPCPPIIFDQTEARRPEGIPTFVRSGRFHMFYSSIFDIIVRTHHTY